MARVPFVTREDLPESQRYIYDRIGGTRGIKTIGPFEALLNSPEATSRVTAVGEYLRFQSELPSNVRELVTLTVANEIGSDIEWNSHERLARIAGVSDASISAVQRGTAPAGLSSEEANVVGYTLELLRVHRVKDETFNAVLKQLGTKNLVDLTLLVGYYIQLSLTFSALGLKWRG